MHHVLAYQLATGAAVVDTSMTAVADVDFPARNNQFVFTEGFSLAWALPIGATITRVNLLTGFFNSIIIPNVYPINRALTIQDQAQPMDMRQYPLALPINEQLNVRVTDTANEQTQLLLGIVPKGWTPQMRRFPDPFGKLAYSPPLMLRATSAPTSIANAWVTGGQLTFADQNPRGGWYALHGAQGFRANGLAVRFRFDRTPLYNGRRLCPGILLQESLATRPSPNDMFLTGMGLFGIFHTFAPPSIDILASDAAATSIELRLMCSFLGDGNYDVLPPGFTDPTLYR